MRIANPTAEPCADCGAPTVLAEFATGVHRVHCGTYRYACTAPKRRPRATEEDEPETPLAA